MLEAFYVDDDITISQQSLQRAGWRSGLGRRSFGQGGVHLYPDSV